MNLPETRIQELRFLASRGSAATQEGDKAPTAFSQDREKDAESFFGMEEGTGGGDLLEGIPDSAQTNADDFLSSMDLRNQLKSLLDKLTEREAAIIKYRYESS